MANILTVPIWIEQTNRPTKDQTEGGDMRFANVEVARSI